MALKWTDLDIKRRIIHVQRAMWRGRKVDEIHESIPKGGKARKVPMTSELATALAKTRNLRERALSTDDGGALTNKDRAVVVRARATRGGRRGDRGQIPGFPGELWWRRRESKLPETRSNGKTSRFARAHYPS